MTTSLSLTVTQRLQLANAVLPKEGSLIEQLGVKEILNKVQVTQEDLDSIGHVLIQDEKGNIVKDQIDLNKDKESAKEYDFSESQIQILKNAVNKLDSDKKIILTILDLCVAIKDSSPKKEGD